MGRSALVAAIAVVALAVLHPASAVGQEDAVVRTVTATQVCLDGTEAAICLGGEHVEHLDLGRFHQGQCVRTSFVGPWRASTVQSVEPRPCGTSDRR